MQDHQKPVPRVILKAVHVPVDVAQIERNRWSSELGGHAIPLFSCF